MLRLSSISSRTVLTHHNRLKWNMNRLRLATSSTRRKMKKSESDLAAESSAADAPLVDISNITELKRIILAEKPSVARDIARVLNIEAPKKHAGFFLSQNKQVAVTWAFGHLVDWTDEEQLASSWSKKTLPILPTKFVLQEKQQDGKVLPRIHSQLELIRNFFQMAKEIVVATDAGREGELIFRLIYELSGSTRPFRRLWVSAQTDQALREGFAKLRDGSELDALYQSAWCRKAADWIVGINATKVYTIYYKGKGPFPNKAVLSVGRVQTPVLRMIVDRFHERERFVSKKYWEIFLDCSYTTEYRFRMKWFGAEKAKEKETKSKSAPSNTKKTKKKDDHDLDAAAEDSDLIFDEAQMQKISSALSATCVVRSFKKEKRTERSPLLFDLTGLQKDCNKRFGWSADFTLNTLQSLYETHKLVTYPRTSSRYLGTNMQSVVLDVLKRLAPPDLMTQMESAKMSMTNDRVYNDSKVRDHFAVIPTGEKASGKLSQAEERLYHSILSRFFAAFLPDAKKEQTELIASNSGHLFRATGTNLLVPGWRIAYGAIASNSSLDAGDATASDHNRLPPSMAPDTEFACRLPPTIEAGETAPPPFHTEATLLQLMETAGKQIEDEEMRDALKDCGIGTPSTRAAIIEKLIRHGYVARSKNSLIPTRQGLGLIEFLKNTPLAQPELTGLWESRLQKMEIGKEDKEKFMNDIRKFTA